MTGDDKAWNAAAAWIIRAEGGYVNNPADPGGETNFGISKRAYPWLDIAHLTAEEALSIYRRDYWLTSACHLIAEVNPALALAVFDTSVHSGPGRALRLLQEALDVAVDGRFGRATLAALTVAPSSLLEVFLYLRAEFMVGTPAASTFLRGWMLRLKKLRQACRELEKE